MAIPQYKLESLKKLKKKTKTDCGYRRRAKKRGRKEKKRRLITKLRVGHWELKPKWKLRKNRQRCKKNKREGLVTEGTEHMFFR